MDNLFAHKGENAHPYLDRIEGSAPLPLVRARLLPGLHNPIEGLEGMGLALDTITVQDAEGWFGRCGFGASLLP
jgi:hypothetical protein